MSSVLEVEDLHAAYGQIKVLHGISFTANEGEITAILGANGAGKTTLLRAISGVIPASGKIMLEGQSLTGKNADRIARKMRVAHVPEGRGTFVNLKVHENLQLGAYPRRDRDEIEEDLAYVYGYFPRLKERSHQTAGHLSGGEQQMLAIARALMLRPRLMLLDEPSLGLAPLVVGDLFEIVSQINQERSTTIVIVEQNATQVLKLASWAHVLESGRAVLSGSAEELSQDEAVRRSYLGY